jgi:8-oxo-dGTP diphosphatase
MYFSKIAKFSTLFLLISIFSFSQIVFEKRPKDFSPTAEVVSCYLKKDDKLLFLKRNAQKPQGNTWGVPAGKMEKNESKEDALIREVYEETNINILNEDLEYLKTVFVKYPNFDFIFHMYINKSSPNTDFLKINQKEHTEFKWLTIPQAKKYDLIPGEDTCLELIFNKNKKKD